MFKALIDSFIDFLMYLASSFASWGISRLPQSVINFLNSDPFTIMLDFIGDITYFMPIYGMFGIIATVLGLLAIIRLIRWIIGLIPTIEG